MLVVFLSALLMIFFLIARLVYLMIFDAAYYQQKAKTLHEREREIKAARGEIIDRNGKVLATNKAVCTISVIHSQITDPERVIRVLADELGIEKEMIRKRVEKVSSREKIKTNVEKETGDRIRAYELDGVKIDEDFKRYYPYGNLASKVLGFTGGDNQGIIGLEVKYENYLKGVNGMILTTTDARGIELADTMEDRVEPVSGDTLQVSLDYNIQEYAQQAAEKVMEEKQADAVVILILNPKTGEIYACVNAPEFDLNAPFTLPEGTDAALNDEEKQAMLNQMWRNRSINDTYEPGSIFKVFTASAALEEGVVKEEDTFYCPGYKLVEDRRIRCARTTGHGSETFVQGVQNSCNPVFIEVGMRLGTENFYKYFEKFGLMGKTGVDLPGEKRGMIPNAEYYDKNYRGSWNGLTIISIAIGQGEVTLTPLQIANLGATIANRGYYVTPHVVKEVEDEPLDTLYSTKHYTKVSSRHYETVVQGMRAAVLGGTCRGANIPGIEVCGKTGTAQNRGKDHSAFMGFAPMNNPKIAIAVYVENGGFGAVYGVPIGALMMEQYLKGELSPDSEVKANDIQNRRIDYGIHER